MTNLVPGFIWHPIDVSGRAKRSKGRGLIAHVAVSESANLVPPGTPATRSADWHFYLPKSGPGFQYIDLDFQCWSSAGANATCPAFESQGGVNSPQTEPWTANQIELSAQILAHLHKTEGTPLQLMPNSLPGSKGLAPHRMGISPWRVAGGEVWSSSNGKVCPGDAKVAQLPQIVARATQLVNGTPTPTVQEDDMRLVRTPDGSVALLTAYEVQHVADPATYQAHLDAGIPVTGVTPAAFALLVAQTQARRSALMVEVQRSVLCNTPSDRAGAWLWDRIAGVDDKTGAIADDVQAVGDAVGKVQTGGVDAKQVAALVIDEIKAIFAAQQPPA